MTADSRSTLEHEIGPDGLLAVRIREGEIHLRAVDGGTVRVRDVNGRNLADLFAIDAATGSLSLRSERGLEIIVGSRAVRRGAGRHSPELEIEVPHRVTLVLEAASGDIEADGLLGDQRYRTASGDIVLRAVSGKLSVEAVSGDVDIAAQGEAQLTVRSVSGDVGIRAASVTTLQVGTTSGDIGFAGALAGSGPFEIETVSGDGLLAPIGDVRVEMTSVTGDLTSDLDGRRADGHGRRSLAVGSGGPLVTFRSMSGDLHVGRPRPIDAPVPPAAIAPPLPEPVPPAVAPPTTGAPTNNGAIAAAYEEARLRILRSLERGEIDVVEAGHRLETLDAGDPDERRAESAEPAPTQGTASNG